MRAQASWMTRADIAILEFLAEKDVTLPPKSIFVNIRDLVDTGHEHAKRRCRELERAGLLEKDPDERGYYRITSDGLRWYREEMDRPELEERKPG